MHSVVTAVVTAGLLSLVAGFAWADEPSAGDLPSEGELPSARDVEETIGSYLAVGDGDEGLIDGGSSSGYGGGFYIRSGGFSLRINATLQARYESWNWDEESDAEAHFQQTRQGIFAGDTSGFSLPRATLKFSGTAPC